MEVKFLKNFKSWKGILYKKFIKPKIEEMKKEKEVEELPGFALKRPSRIFEFPEVKNISEVNITYPLIEPFAYANIKWNEDEKSLIYYVIEPELNDKEREWLEKISLGLMELVEIGLEKIKEVKALIDYLEKNVNKVIKDLALKISPSSYIKIMYYIYRNFAGFNEIEPLLQDPNIEDISCDGLNLPIYVVHRKYGSLKTNVIFKNEEKLRDFIVKLAERCGRYVSYAEPILAGTLPDGSRVSATLAGDVATHGPVFTIRKFSEKPFSPIEIIEMKTANTEIMAYFWFLMEQGASILIVGGVATGKTSFLNSICMFIPPERKIVSIEDTREIRLVHEHWIPGLARTGFGIPTQTGERYGEVSMFDLLKESFRQNPDYVIVGEVRGKETYVMFQGMASGHPSISTFHAGSIETVIKRLTTPPIELSPSLIESLDIVPIMVHAREKGKAARRIKEIVEIVGYDPNTDKINYNVVYKWDPSQDLYVKVNKSLKLEKFAYAKGISIEEVNKEIWRRKILLEYLLKNRIKDYREVSKYINSYYKEKRSLFEKLNLPFEPEEKEAKEKIEVKKELPKRIEKKVKRKRVTILEMLGFKVLGE